MERGPRAAARLAAPRRRRGDLYSLLLYIEELLWNSQQLYTVWNNCCGRTAVEFNIVLYIYVEYYIEFHSSSSKSSSMQQQYVDHDDFAASH